MRLPLLLIIFLFIKTGIGFSQPQNIKSNSEITSIYKITDVEAQQIFQESNLELTDNFFHTFVDTFSIRKYNRQSLNGYYLFIKAKGELLDVELKEYNSISAVVLNNQRDLMIQVIDSLGNVLRDAEVIFNDKKLKYDRKVQAFRKKKVHRDGFLVIKAGGETIFYDVNDKNKTRLIKRKYRRFTSTKIGFIVTTPFRWGGKVWHFFKQGFRNSYWNWGIFRGRRKNKSHRGYIVLNQPKYLPGDTVKIKAYLTSHKGKPLTKDLQLKLTKGYTSNKSLFSIPLQSKGKGSYTYEFVLGDSLQLDKFYHLTFFYKENKKTKTVMSHSLAYEDYQLDEVDYTFKVSQKEYTSGEKIILLAEGKDKNGWTIPDGRLKITATTDEARVTQFYNKKVIVPNVLWEHTQDLDSRGETQIIFPKEKLPSADLTVNVKAEFFNSNGELQNLETTFEYDAEKEKNEKIEVTLDGEYIVAKYLVNGIEQKAEGVLYLEGYYNNVESERKVKFPFREKLNPFITDYDFEVGDAEGYFWTDDSEGRTQVLASGYQNKDSIYAFINNPHQLQVRYQLRTKNKLLSEGKTQDSLFQIHLKNKKRQSVFLSYQFVWGDESYDYEVGIHFYKKLLSFEVEQPQKVEPGERAQFKVKVKTAKDKPAKNVNLTAGAVNSQFEDLRNIKEPSIQYRPSRRPFKYDSFELQQKYTKKKQKPITKRWYKELQLDSSAFYQLLHPKNGVAFNYITVNSPDTFYQKIAQFAPYLVKNGQREPIYLIYCNRQLVYYHDVDNIPPYSFIGQNGINQITIRTREHLYTIDNVLLENGKKLELSIDVNHYITSPFAKDIKRETVADEWSIAEKNILNRKIFMIRKYSTHTTNYLWQNDFNIHRINTRHPRNGFLKVGPFSPNQPLWMLQKDGWVNHFKYEPNHIYEVRQNRERLYFQPLFPLRKKATLPKVISKKPIGQLVFSPNSIQAKTPFQQRLEEGFSKNYRARKDSTGFFIFKYDAKPKEDSTIFAIVLLQKDSIINIYKPQVRRMDYLPPNDYNVILFTSSGNYLQQDIQIVEDQMLFLDLNEVPFTLDSARVLFKEIFLKYGTQKRYDNEIKLYLSERNKPLIEDDLLGSGMIQITGTVTDESGEPLIGATIMCMKNGKVYSGTTADIDGAYQLEVPDNLFDIVVSYTGYATYELTNYMLNSNNSQVDISLQEAAGMMLDEIVVTGYGSVKKRNLSGSVSTLDLPTRSIHALAGATAGVSSEGSDIKIRGASSVSIYGSRASSVEYYVDGIKVNGELLYESELNSIELRSKFSDYAYFQPNLITDEKGEAYFTATFPDNITAWKTYVVGMDNKLRGGSHFGEIQSFKKLTAQLSLPRFLIEGDKTNIIGKSINFTQDTFKITTAFKQEDEILETKTSEITDAVIENTTINAPSNSDSLSLSYLLSMENYSDGEERAIPIFQKGVEEVEGVFKVLNDSDTFEKSFDANKGEVQIRIEDNILEVLLEDLYFLKQYPYGCNEQTASRLIALILEKDLKQLLGQKFKDEKKIRKAIRRLEKTQNADGSWGWWANGKYNAWMTSYVLNALQKAKEANYKTKALEKGLIFLTNQLPSLNDRGLLNSLLLFSDINQNLDYKNYINHLDTTLTSRYDKFALIKIRQAQGLSYSIDSLLQHKEEDVFGGWYFGEENYRWYNNSFQLTLLAHDIFKIEKDSNAINKIQQYFLSKKTRRGWRNTFETAKILLAILPDLMKEKKTLVKNNVQLSGAMNETISEFPFEAKFSSNNSLQIKKTGSSPIFFTAHQSFWNKNPKEKKDIFSIKTSLKQNDKITNNLQAAVAADLIIELEVKKAAEYVMIEIPIPAGCSYHSKTQTYRNNESHREYFKDRTAIFCEDLPVGKYNFKISLEPRFSGIYTLNPTKVEQMYFPVFYGRNEMGKVSIK